MTLNFIKRVTCIRSLVVQFWGRKRALPNLLLCYKKSAIDNLSDPYTCTCISLEFTLAVPKSLDCQQMSHMLVELSDIAMQKI